jgi:hypothetical protein
LDQTVYGTEGYTFEPCRVHYNINKINDLLGKGFSIRTQKKAVTIIEKSVIYGCVFLAAPGTLF